jgi:hypothetical protein
VVGEWKLTHDCLSENNHYLEVQKDNASWPVTISPVMLRSHAQTLLGTNSPGEYYTQTVWKVAQSLRQLADDLFGELQQTQSDFAGKSYFGLCTAHLGARWDHLVSSYRIGAALEYFATCIRFAASSRSAIAGLRAHKDLCDNHTVQSQLSELMHHYQSLAMAARGCGNTKKMLHEVRTGKKVDMVLP